MWGNMKKSKYRTAFKKALACLMVLCTGAALTVPVITSNVESAAAASSGECIAYFSFDNAFENNALSSDGSDDAKVTIAEGDASITTLGRDAYLGNAVRLDGDCLNVTTADGGSLLTGLRELTVSFYSKPDADNAAHQYWGFFAAPNGDTIVDDPNTEGAYDEQYLGVIANPTGITAERFNNTGVRPEKNAAYNSALGNGWHHIVVVFSKEDTTVYVDGKPGSTVASEYAIDEILGDTSVLQIGKANWGTGEFYKGYIDEYKIFNYAMSQEQVKALEPEQMQVPQQIASIDFDDADPGTLTGELAGDGIIVSPLTKDPIITNEDSYNGQSLKLDGDASVKVTDVNGESLLTGLDEMTVSYYSLLNPVAEWNYTFYAANGDKQAGEDVTYAGIWERCLNGDARLEADRLHGEDTAELVAEIPNEYIWHHIVVVFARDGIRTYVDGNLANNDTTKTYSLRNILGNKSIL